ncbi:PAS domain S-box protein [Streptomyces peucetius]|uniref:GAF domain-containing protein n=1 Tax=Streptomyces peucetius TaxID=1950 RepID=UPI00299F8488|nr:PAS domain S-box protein [Streptomyces peucetius]
MRTLRAVLDRAEEATRDEHLLTLPALPRSHVFHDWLFDQIVGQLAGAHPTAWTVVPREPGAGPSELVPWDAGQVHAGRVPTIAADERNRIIAANGPAADLLGWHSDELLGLPLITLIPEHLQRRHISAFTSLLLSGQPRILGRSVPLPALHPDGPLVPVRLVIQTQETADGRTVFVAQLTPRAAAPLPASRPPGRARPAAQEEPGGPPPPDAPEGERGTDRRRADLPTLERLSLQADIGAALSNAMDLDEGLERVGRILNDRLADWCAVDLFAEEAQVERVCVVRSASQGPWPEEYEGRLPPVSDTARGPLARALRGAGPLLLAKAPPPSQVTSPLDADYLELFRRMGASSAVVAPLRARREVIGALTVARSGRERPFRRTICRWSTTWPGASPWQWTTPVSTRRRGTPPSASSGRCCPCSRRSSTSSWPPATRPRPPPPRSAATGTTVSSYPAGTRRWSSVTSPGTTSTRRSP